MKPTNQKKEKKEDKNKTKQTKRVRNFIWLYWHNNGVLMLIYCMVMAACSIELFVSRFFHSDGLWNRIRNLHIVLTHTTEEIQERKLIHYRLLDITVTQTHPKITNRWKSKKMIKAKKAMEEVTEWNNSTLNQEWESEWERDNIEKCHAFCIYAAAQPVH